MEKAMQRGFAQILFVWLFFWFFYSPKLKGHNQQAFKSSFESKPNCVSLSVWVMNCLGIDGKLLVFLTNTEQEKRTGALVLSKFFKRAFINCARGALPFSDCHFRAGSACNNLKCLPQQVVSVRGNTPTPPCLENIGLWENIKSNYAE